MLVAEFMGIPITWPIIWVMVAVVFGVIEVLTMGLATIWFCGGAVVASLAAMIGAPVEVQVALFFIVSIALLYFTRPLALKKLNNKVEKTNADALIGKIGIVTETIVPFSTGQVKIEGKDWTAVTENNDITVEKQTKVRILKIEGVKLVVLPYEEYKTEA